MRKLLLFITSLLLVGVINGQPNRSIDGYGNNVQNPEWGATDIRYERLTSVAYDDGYNSPAEALKPNAREVSNEICDQNATIFNTHNLSDFVWIWGQFIDHDFTLGRENEHEAPFVIDIPECDTYFDPLCNGSYSLYMARSVAAAGTGVPGNPRQQVNSITSFLDASAVYGSTLERSNWLRTFRKGRLRTSKGGLLPYNTMNSKYNSEVDENAPEMATQPGMEKYFVAGDIRANEQPALIAMHTLFVREHNRRARKLAKKHRNWSDEQIYQRARKEVGAIIQAITYEEFLPALGIELGEYTGYDPTVNPTIMMEFASSAYRIGHTMINTHLMRYDKHWDIVPQGHASLAAAFFNPPMIADEGGIDPFLRGASTQLHQEVDSRIIGDLRNFLFGPPGAGGLDLATLNIARGREHGLPDYQTLRNELGLTMNSFEDISSNPVVVETLRNVYGGNVNAIDSWIGMLCEDHDENGRMGTTMTYLFQKQFAAMRDGDRYYYENDTEFRTKDIKKLKRVTLGEVIRRNTKVKGLQYNVFYVQQLDRARLLAKEELETENIETKALAAYPNPIKSSFTLEVNATTEGQGTMQMMNINGQVMMNRQLELTEGQNVFNLDVNDKLSAGVYIIVVKSADGVQQLKVVKQ